MIGKMIRYTKASVIGLSRLPCYPLGVYWNALGYGFHHMRARDAPAVWLGDRQRERRAGLGYTWPLIQKNKRRREINSSYGNLFKRESYVDAETEGIKVWKEICGCRAREIALGSVSD